MVSVCVQLNFFACVCVRVCPLQKNVAPDWYMLQEKNCLWGGREGVSRPPLYDILFTAPLNYDLTFHSAAYIHVIFYRFEV